MNTRSISLVISAYNEEKRIGACIKSALENAEGKFFEIIVVDNGSSDSTISIAKSFENVKVLEENTRGVMHARQKGYLESTGDIIAFVDADNLIPKGWVEKAEKAFEDNPDLALLSGPYTYYDVAKWRQKASNFFWRFLAVPAYLSIGYMAVFGNLLIRRGVLEKMGGLDTSIEFYGDDSDTARRASKFGKVKFDPAFIMPSSGRRFTGQGWIRTSLDYISNFFSEAFLKKPITLKHKDYR